MERERVSRETKPSYLGAQPRTSTVIYAGVARVLGTDESCYVSIL